MLTLFNQGTVEKANTLRKHDLYPFFRSIEGSEATTVSLKGHDMVMIGSNNYLGLTHHPHVKEMALKAIEKYGTGCTGSRFLNGTLTLHEELEERLAKFIGHEAALVFSTGMQTNLGSISAIVGPRDLMLNDMENHASIVDATRLSLGTNMKYKHNNMEDLERILSEYRHKYDNAFIISDGVFSMTGAICDLPRIVELAKKYDCITYIDDAHGIGVLGQSGNGVLNHFGLADQVDLAMGTFSKSFASIGGCVSGSKEMIDYIKHCARSFMFSASMPPSAVATVLGCLDVIEKEPEIFVRLQENVNFMKKGFKELGFYTYNSETPIIPILIGDDTDAFKLSMRLGEMGVFATPVISPAVPKNQALIRTSYMATHNRSELEYVLDAFKKLSMEFDFPTSLTH